MEDSLRKTDIQKTLFDEILKKLPPQHALVDVVADLLEVSSDSAYRRIRCDKIMDVGEVAVLCRRFGVSLDALLKIPGAAVPDTNGSYFYSPMDLSDVSNYSVYMRNLATRLSDLSTKPGAEIISSAQDVPFFHFMPYKELTFFKLFAWTSSVYPIAMNYDEFARTIESKELLDSYNKIATCYRLIPSKEIWTNSTTDTFIKLVNYHFEMGHFAEPESALSLCNQFIDLLNTLERWTEKGNKGEAGFIPFQLYLSDVDMENSFNLMRSEREVGCILKLFTINSLYITDRRFCSETENWLDHLARRATLISGASERERHKFFNSQRQKLRFLMDMISSL